MPKQILSLIFVLAFTNSIPCEETNPAPASALDLTVRECLLMALENNRSLSVERYGPEIYQTFVRREEAQFDPSIEMSGNASKTQGQQTSGVDSFRQVTSKRQLAEIAVQKRLPVGLEVDAGMRLEYRTSNVFEQLYSTRLGASLVMPAMEGYGEEVNLAGVRQAETNSEITECELRGFINALAMSVEEMYWGIQLAKEELRIQNTSLDLAQQQFAETKDRIDVGALGEIELAAAEGEVAFRESAVIDAESLLRTKNLDLLRALNPPADDIWTVETHLTDTPTENTPNEPGPVERHVRIALDNRPDLHQAGLNVESNDIELVRTRNGLLPRLDFFITLGRSGYARSFTDTGKSLVDDDYYDASAGFLFQLPIGNRADRARHRHTQLSIEEAELALVNFSQLVELEVRKAFLEVERAARQIDVTRRASQLKEANQQAELEKFKVGKSTNLLVLVAQRDLIQARLDEIRAQIELRIAAASLHFADGTILDWRGIVTPAR